MFKKGNRQYRKIASHSFGGLVLFSVIFVVSAAHRFHTTLTLIDYNEKEKKAEISIQMFTHDVNEIFEKKYPKKFDLESKDAAGKILFEFVEKNFILKNKNNESLKLRLIGYETDADSMWIYLETNLNESPEGFQLQNSLFFENCREQSNIVICKYLGKKADLAFKVGDSFKEIEAKLDK